MWKSLLPMSVCVYCSRTVTWTHTFSPSPSLFVCYIFFLSLSRYWCSVTLATEEHTVGKREKNCSPSFSLSRVATCTLDTVCVCLWMFDVLQLALFNSQGQGQSAFGVSFSDKRTPLSSKDCHYIWRSKSGGRERGRQLRWLVLSFSSKPLSFHLPDSSALILDEDLRTILWSARGGIFLLSLSLSFSFPFSCAFFLLFTLRWTEVQ